MATFTKIVLIVEYDGTRYHGFQLQARAPTIQGEIEKALRKLSGKKTRIIAASRTDAGVHARRQVVSFRTDLPLPLAAYEKGLNHYLPDDIAVREAHVVDGALDVRRQAVSREYRYDMLVASNRSPMRRCFTYLVSGKIDVEAMDRACRELVGEHDLCSFATRMEPRKRNTVKKVYRANVEKNGDLVTFTIVANSFLPHQVRNTVGALIQVGTGKMTIDEFRGIIEAKRPGLAGPTVPASGLCLVRVNYPGPFGDDTWVNAQ